ncbi:kynureninase, partial [archaeon]
MWVEVESPLQPSMAALVGALPSEVVMMNSLTANLHVMMISFYQPTPQRHKILIEKKAFPSDYHAVVSQLQLHGYDASTSLIEVEARLGELTINEDDIDALLAEQGESIALVLFSGIQYYTGQFFDLERIARSAKAAGCKVGFDLAHAVGNVPLRLHDWQVDFACWCTYKYMNCGPGSIAGCFVHEEHGKGELVGEGEHRWPVPRRLGGWWGHRTSDRFQMAAQFIP